MAKYQIARRTTNTTSGQAAMDIATSTGLRPRVTEWSITLAAATASTYGINRSTAIGTRTTPTAILAREPDDPALTGITLVDTALAHSVQPTLSSEYLDRVALPATIGTGYIWLMEDDPLIIDVSLSFVLQNLATNGVLDSKVVADV